MNHIQDFEYFFRVPLFKFLLHLVLWSVILVNIFFLLEYDSIKTKQEQLEIDYSKVASKNNTLENQSRYWQSNLYANKYAKYNNFKVIGEVVIDTSMIESPQTEPSIYYPDRDNNVDNNGILWQRCIFDPTYINSESPEYNYC